MDSLKQKWKLTHPQCQPTHGLCTAFPFPSANWVSQQNKADGLKSEHERAVSTDSAASQTMSTQRETRLRECARRTAWQVPGFPDKTLL